MHQDRTNFKDEMQFVFDGGAGEERTTGSHLEENAADAPQVNGARILGRAEQHVGRTVPDSQRKGSH